MNTIELQELLSEKEGLKLDFKREYKLYDVAPANTDKKEWADYVRGQWDELIKDVIALANGNVGTADQDGLLIIGVDDELPPSGTRQIHDTSQLKITEQQVLARVNSACDPPIPNLTCERVKSADKEVIVITVHSSPFLHETSRPLQPKKGKTYSARTAFVRRGESVFPATDKERRAISYEKVASLQGKLDHIELDRKLFVDIREILKSDGVILFVREVSFDGAFEREYLRDLYAFEDFCKRPECEFMDEELERLRLQLLGGVKEFLRATGRHTFPLKTNREWNRIPRDPMQEPETIAWFSQKAKNKDEFDRLIEEERDHVRRIGLELNQLADRVCEIYDEFVKYGRRKLAA